MDWKTVHEFVQVDRSVPEVTWPEPGTEGGLKQLKHFIENTLKKYGTLRNDPTEDGLSKLSPWFHTGNIDSCKT